MNRIYFTDRDLGKRFPSILVEGGLTVERHADLFPPDGSDEQWLEYCGSRNRVALTHDQRIRYKPNECDAVIRHRVGLFVLIGHARYDDLAKNFLATLPKIESFLDLHKPPFIAKIYRPAPAEMLRNSAPTGEVTLWFPR